MTKTVIFDYGTDNLSGFQCAIEQVALNVTAEYSVSSEKFGDVALQFLQNYVKIEMR
jgi:hypothetical protein